MSEFQIFQGNLRPRQVSPWPEGPPWRTFGGAALTRQNIPDAKETSTFLTRPEIVELVNAALHLRRPLLVTGKPGTGKTSLAEAIAYELKLGQLLEWRINSRSGLQEGLYQYDAIGRLQDAALRERTRAQGSVLETLTTETPAAPSIGKYIRLGPLGTALLPSDQPRVLLIDEIDKSDVDLPNDLLHVFEKGSFEIPELARDVERKVKVRPAAGDGEEDIPIQDGRIECRVFPIIILTSNGEREFPGAFKRRCIRIDMPEPESDELAQIVRLHFKEQLQGVDFETVVAPLVKAFMDRKKDGDLATDQLLNAVRLRMSGAVIDKDNKLGKAILRPLTGST